MRYVLVVMEGIIYNLIIVMRIYPVTVIEIASIVQGTTISLNLYVYHVKLIIVFVVLLLMYVLNVELVLILLVRNNVAFVLHHVHHVYQQHIVIHVIMVMLCKKYHNHQ